MFNWDKVQYKEDGKVLLLWRHERIFEEGLVKPGMFCCDVGGWGHLTERMRQEGCNTIILDKFTAEQYYPDRVRNETYIEGNICDEILAEHYENQFDLITCYEVLEHVGLHLDQHIAFQNMYKMLKPGGWLVGTFPIVGMVHKFDDPTVTNWLGAADLCMELDYNNFQNAKVDSTGSITKDEISSSWYFKGQKL